MIFLSRLEIEQRPWWLYVPYAIVLIILLSLALLLMAQTPVAEQHEIAVIGTSGPKVVLQMPFEQKFTKTPSCQAFVISGASPTGSGTAEIVFNDAKRIQFVVAVGDRIQIKCKEKP